jgi:hypothetical protein
MDNVQNCDTLIQFRRFHLKTETEFSLGNVFKMKDWIMGNVQNCESYVNIPSSQTYRSH